MKYLFSIVFLGTFISGSVLGMPWNKLPGSEGKESVDFKDRKDVFMFVIISVAFQPNPDEYGGFLEGDLVLTPDQMINPQNGILSSFYRWENNIVYYSIGSAFSK